VASTFNHATQGAILHGAGCAVLGATPEVTSVLVTLGAVCGALPDVFGWAGRQAGMLEEWALYGSAHHGPVWKILRWIPAYGLHGLVDRPFHEPDGHWWPRLWWAEALLWGVNVLAIKMLCF